MPWRIGPSLEYRTDAASCPECHGERGEADGRCGTCGAMLVAPDPALGEFLTTSLIPADPDTRRPLPRRLRRSRTITIQDGWRRSADGSLAKVFRLVDRVNNRYIEKVHRGGVLIRHVDEPLTEHRGRGSAGVR